MNELEALTEAPPAATRRTASAPEAAAWIDHPTEQQQSRSAAVVDRLANEPEWEGKPWQP